MNKVCREHIEPGMVLARDVRGVDGSVVLEKGRPLTGEHPGILAGMDVGAVYVQEDPALADEELLLSRLESFVRRFFLYVDHDNPAMVELYRLTMRRTWEAVKGGWQMPCEQELLALDVDVEHMRDLFPPGAGSPQELVRHETELASFPDVYFRIKEVMDSPASTAEDIARVVGADVGLSAKLLQLVNSPFFGLASKVTSVAHAVSLIGTRELSTLALGISAVNFFKDIPPELIDMPTFWRHSIACAVFAKLLGGAVSGGKGERFFTAGLLHDAGRLVMFKNMPYCASEAMLFARNNMVPLVDAEREILGYDHTDVALALLEEWDFPPSITRAIGHHHAPDRSGEPRDAAVLQLADNMANAMAVSTGGKYVLPGMQGAEWASLGLRVEDLDGFVARFERQFEELCKVFL